MSEDSTRNLSGDGLKIILDRLDSIDSRLTSLEEKVDRRLQETRPIWEQVLSRLDNVESKLGNLENGMRSGFRNLERQISVLMESILIVRADHRDLQKRMDKLESDPQNN